MNFSPKKQLFVKNPPHLCCALFKDMLRYLKNYYIFA